MLYKLQTTHQNGAPDAGSDGSLFEASRHRIVRILGKVTFKFIGPLPTSFDGKLSDAHDKHNSRKGYSRNLHD